MSHTTVVVIMDAGRPQELHHDTMPFIQALADRSIKSSHDALPAHAQAAAILSGQHPDTAHTLSPYTYDPTGSPFSWLRRIGPLSNRVGSGRATSPTRQTIARTTSLLTGATHSDPAAIPTRLLPYFRPNHPAPAHEPGTFGSPSIFDLCRRAGRGFRYVDASVADHGDAAAELVRQLRVGSPHALHVARLAVQATDPHERRAGHPASHNERLLDLDAKVSSVHAALSAAYPSWDLVICGQGGTTTPKTRIDLFATLHDTDAMPGKDHVVFVHPTFAVFWYLTPKGRRTIEAALPHIDGTHVLDDAERRRYRIPTGGASGDRILATDPGVLFSPDFMHGAHAGASGTHAHLGPAAESAGFSVVASTRHRIAPHDAGPRPLVDLFPTLSRLIGVPVPETQEGTSLLTPLRTTPLIQSHGGHA